MAHCTASIVTDLAALAPDEWDRLDHGGNPFLAQPFLAALEQSGSVTPETGWQPHHLALHEAGELVAFAPTYIKSHSHGEFVFDWAWADAFQRYGRAWYPKLLTAIPYSPVTGPRLLVRRGHPDAEALRARLVDEALAVCEALGLSSWHCNFHVPQDALALRREPLLARHDWQFHWQNRQYASFDDFLAGLRSRKRKNMQRDRRLARDAGIGFEWRRGGELDDSERRFVYRCYRRTFLEYGNHPALTREFFDRVCDEMPQAVLVMLAIRDGRPIAMSWFLEGGGRLYGRYWGCIEQHPGLHFETAYHQGIEYCIANGLAAFEPGAQGEHKYSRGFEATQTNSAHFVRDPVFRAAIAVHLEHEAAWLHRYREGLEAHAPYRRAGSA